MKNEKTGVSSRRHQANIESSSVSTGPRSFGGKARSSRNSFKHGLSTSAKIFSSEDAFAWGKKIAASLADDRDEIVRLATEVASAQLQLIHVRNLRSFPSHNSEAIRKTDDRLGRLDDMERKITEALRLDRYEQRAMSRRKKAVDRLRDALR